MNIDQLALRAGMAASLLRSLANEKRLLILCQLYGGERSVGELENVVGLSQSALSQHLAKLRSAGVVATRREAQTIYYSLKDPGAERVIGALYEHFCGPGRMSKSKK
jgi:ArsR family transcriptional regulator